MLKSLTRYAITGLAFSFSLAALASAEPNLEIPESLFDFGYAPQKSKLTHVFWLKSTGDDSLIIGKIVPG